MFKGENYSKAWIPNHRDKQMKKEIQIYLIYYKKDI